MIYEWLFGLYDLFPEVVFDLDLIDGFDLHLFISACDFFFYAAPVLDFGGLEVFLESFGVHLGVGDFEVVRFGFFLVFGDLEGVKEFEVLFHVAE